MHSTKSWFFIAVCVACLQCNQINATTLPKCGEGTRLGATDPKDPKPDVYYPYTPPEGTCKPCQISNCGECTYDYTKCNVCAPGYGPTELVNNTTPDVYGTIYPKEYSKDCVPCQVDGCGTCAYNATQCISMIPSCPTTPIPNAAKAKQVQYSPTNSTDYADGFCPTLPGWHTLTGYGYNISGTVVNGKCIDCDDSTQGNYTDVNGYEGFAVYAPKYCTMLPIAEQVASNSKCDNLVLTAVCFSARLGTMSSPGSWWPMTFVFNGTCNGTTQQVVALGGFTAKYESTANDAPLINTAIPAEKWTWSMSNVTSSETSGGSPSSGSGSGASSPSAAAPSSGTVAVSGSVLVSFVVAFLMATI